jgi:hypothetical protein
MPNRRPFAMVMQSILIGLLIVSLVLIAQQYSQAIYQLGLILLVATTIVQIGFGNVPPNASFGKSMKLLALFLAIIAFVFGLGIVLVPTLLRLARG